ncbi:MAG: mechanosensitive ion channel, partial [Cyclobacteriaceae bacterium]|nr:mechanosensitive ion channel [Cyclobacteriaceae bacterium]
NENIKSVKETIRELIDQEERILKDPEPFIGVSGLGDNSVDLVLRLWVKRENFLPVFHDMLERIKNTFDEKGISLPYPQRDIHVYNEK